MLEFAGLADDGRLAVALGLPGLDAQGLDALFAQYPAQLFADGGEFVQVFRITSGVGIFDDGHGDCAPRCRLDALAHFDTGFVDHDHQFADVC